MSLCAAAAFATSDIPIMTAHGKHMMSCMTERRTSGVLVGLFSFVTVVINAISQKN
jgi:hypothetical protein